jgi:hypothetical protein
MNSTQILAKVEGKLRAGTRSGAGFESPHSGGGTRTQIVDGDDLKNAFSIDAGLA